MKKITLTSHNAEETAAVVVDFLQDGGVVLMPMDTSYGLAVDATNEAAVNRLFEIKGRDVAQVSSVVVSDRQTAERFGQFDERAGRLWDAFMPGSLTLVVPVADGVSLPAGIVTESKTIGLRHPANPLTQLVAERLERPYTATSANHSGQPAAYSAEEFLRTVPDELLPHLVVDGGELPLGLSSTVVSVVDGVEILRDGAIPAASIKEVSQ